MESVGTEREKGNKVEIIEWCLWIGGENNESGGEGMCHESTVPIWAELGHGGTYVFRL